MKLPWRKSDSFFLPPNRRAPRGFTYLDDDIVINSLSALESGKVDEVVEKINLAQESGLRVGFKLGSDKIGIDSGADDRATESLQAEVIRRRTRFSIFEIWYESLCKKQAIGEFQGWGKEALRDVRSGQVIKMRGSVAPVAVHSALRVILWYINEIREENTIFTNATEPEQLEMIDDIAQVAELLRGKRAETNALIIPKGDLGPKVGASFREEWIVEPVGRWDGEFTIVAQVDDVLQEGASWASMRIIEDAPLTPMEKQLLETAWEPMRDLVGAFGMDVDEESFSIEGPALILRPIAIYR